MELHEIIKGLEEVRDCESIVYQSRVDAIEAAITALRSKGSSLKRVADAYGLTTDGVIFALEQYQTVICEITQNRMSKLSYFATDILNVANDLRCEGCELLDEQTPRVLVPADLQRTSDDEAPVWLESRDTYQGREGFWIFPRGISSGGVLTYMAPHMEDFGYLSIRDYGKEWCCFSGRPTDEQREVIPWT